MPRISELPLLDRPITEADNVLIESGMTSYRAPGTVFRGVQGIPGTMTGVRHSVTHTTPILAPGASHTGTVDLAPTFELLGVILSAGCRLRLYSTAAARAADAARPLIVKPIPGRGLILEINLPTSGTQHLDPHAHGSNMEAEPSAAIPFHLVNNGPAGQITLEFHYIPKEA